MLIPGWRNWGIQNLTKLQMWRTRKGYVCHPVSIKRLHQHSLPPFFQLSQHLSIHLTSAWRCSKLPESVKTLWMPKYLKRAWMKMTWHAKTFCLQIILSKYVLILVNRLFKIWMKIQKSQILFTSMPGTILLFYRFTLAILTTLCLSETSKYPL